MAEDNNDQWSDDVPLLTPHCHPVYCQANVRVSVRKGVYARSDGQVDADKSDDHAARQLVQRIGEHLTIYNRVTILA